MKYLILKDRRRRILFAFYEQRSNVFRAIRDNQNFSIKKRKKAYTTLNSFPRDAHLSRIRNRCVLTGRSRAIYRKFGLSRLRFRKFASEGILNGIKKAS